MGKITIVDLEVYFCVGVTAEERTRPQRLLVSVDLSCDFTGAVLSDRVEKTINYFDVAQEVLKFGDGRSWKLIERLASELADMVMAKYRPQAVLVEVKKFPVAQARYVSVTVARPAQR